MYRNTFGESVVYGPNLSTTERQPEANQHDYLMVLWKGELFRVPLSTLQRAKKEGGWGMIHPAAKCMALFFHCMREQGQKNRTVTADWTQRWGLQEHTKNPPYAGGLQPRWNTYINTTWNRRTSAPEEGMRPHSHTKTPIHNDSNHHESNGCGFRKACNKNWPYRNWARVWGNLSAAPVPESTRIDWFRVIHDLIQTNERLQRIRMVQTDICRKCTMKDTLEHKIKACG